MDVASGDVHRYLAARRLSHHACAGRAQTLEVSGHARVAACVEAHWDRAHLVDWIQANLEKLDPDVIRARREDLYHARSGRQKVRRRSEWNSAELELATRLEEKH